MSKVSDKVANRLLGIFAVGDRVIWKHKNNLGQSFKGIVTSLYSEKTQTLFPHQSSLYDASVLLDANTMDTSVYFMELTHDED